MIHLKNLKEDLPNNYEIRKENTKEIDNFLNYSYCVIQSATCSIAIDNITAMCGGVLLSQFSPSYDSDQNILFLKNIVRALQKQNIGYIQYFVAENQDWEDEIVEALNVTGFTGHDVGYNPKTWNSLTLYHIVNKDDD